MGRSRLVLFIFLTAVQIAHADFKKGELRELNQLSLQVLSTFSPKEYCYIGIGSSPTALIALLQSLEVPAFNFPFSRGSMDQIVSHIDPTSPVGKRVMDHFKFFVPSQSEPNSPCYNRKLVFIDFVNTGKSIRLFEQSLKYTKKHNPDLLRFEPSFLVLSYRGSPSPFPIDSHHLDIELGPTTSVQMESSAYDEVREYPEWHSRVDDPSVYRERFSFQVFKKDLLKEFNKNPKWTERLVKVVESGEVKLSFCERLLYAIGL